MAGESAVIGRSWVTIVAGGVVGLVLALMVRTILSDAESSAIQATFENESEAVQLMVAGELGAVREKLVAFRAFFGSSETVDESEFNQFSNRLLQGHHELRGFFWAESSGAQCVVRFADPPGVATVGFDLAASPPHIPLLGRASLDGEPLAVPFESASTSVLARAATRKGQSGFIGASVDLREVLVRAMGPLGGKDLRVTLLDVGTDSPEASLRKPRESRHRRDLSVGFAQQTVQIRIDAGPTYGRDFHTAAPLAAFWAILVATAATLGYIWVVQSHAVRVGRLVKERTARIREMTGVQRAILESAEYAIISFRPDGTILTFNPAAERMLGCTADDVIGRRTPLEFVGAGQLGEAGGAGDLASLIGRAGAGVTGPWRLRRADGSEFPASLSISALHGETGQVSGYLAIARDISERIRADAELRRAKGEAESASLAKSQFLANMSHELRTPLTAVLGYAELLQEDARAEGRIQVARDLQRIHDAGRHLLRLIDDVLDLSKVEAGRIALHPEAVDVAALVEDVATTLRPIAEQKGNELAVHSGHGSIEADPTRLKQVLVNLVANAARFTENGRIQVEAEVGPEMVTFLVRDTGIGMTEDELARVFEPFVQADTTTTRRFGGTGLGLAIARQFTELMGGSLEARSEPGKGSEFTLTVPVRRT